MSVLGDAEQVPTPAAGEMACADNQADSVEFGQELFGGEAVLLRVVEQQAIGGGFEVPPLSRRLGYLAPTGVSCMLAPFC